MSEKLAIHGGDKVRKKPFPFYKTIGDEEVEAVTNVLKSGILSKYLGANHPDFYGGPNVQAFEREWGEFFGSKHVTSVNSATSGIIAALAAIGLEEGDEVIVTPYSMSISATAPLFYRGVPVFADIEPEYFCLDPKSVEEKITSRTKAIIVVDLFGGVYDDDAINEIAQKHKLFVIEDAAQAPMATYKSKYAGTLGHIGIHSLNYHKHIHTGEGGMVLTDDEELAKKIQLVRNHAEAAVGGMGISNLRNMLGFNFRMTEIEAAIGREQLKKLPELVAGRRDNIAYLEKKLSDIPFLKTASVRPDSKHAWYVQSMLFDKEKAGVHRDQYINAVKEELAYTENRESEGVHIGVGYTLLHLLPIFQKKTELYGKNSAFALSDSPYTRGTCPVAEELFDEKLVLHHLVHPALSREDLDDVIEAFHKVARNKDSLL